MGPMRSATDRMGPQPLFQASLSGLRSEFADSANASLRSPRPSCDPQHAG